MKIKKISNEKFLLIISYIFNTFMIGTEVLFLVTFIKYNVFLFIPFVILNLIISLAGYILLYVNKLYLWTILLYFICQETMVTGTIFMGMDYGFCLYSASMITVSFYIHYIGRKMKYRPANPLNTAVVTVLLYFVSYAVNQFIGPLYIINNTVKRHFFLYNSVIVFTIILSYMYIFLNRINKTEMKLENIAMVDRLTGLYNRHYLLSHISRINSSDIAFYWIAILDIDNFKKVNDVYGHNCGDHVLKVVSKMTADICRNCTVCRWGGEEFIILASEKIEKNVILEELRSSIADTVMKYEDKELKVTVTIGTHNYDIELTTEQWISEADKKLYEGKNSGKNQVVY